ncbi:MAG: hypothetical protein F6K28_56865, partial [Microcoleus sp. SIO2G3]|nr:hypothetical protein [Microcoleus sp. SIO2G3]
TPVKRRIVTPRSNPVPRQAASTSQPAASPTTQQAQAAPPAPPATDPFAAGFPRYPNAIEGSFGLPAAYESASQRTGDAIDEVAAFFQRELVSAGYQAMPLDQANRQAFQVTRGDTSKVLTLISNPEGSGTSIVLSDSPLPENLDASSVVSPAEQRFYAEIPIPAPDGADWFDVNELALEQSPDNQPALAKLLSEPNAFFSALGGITPDGFEETPTPRSELVRGVVGRSDPASIYSLIQPDLQTGGFTISPASRYGGGETYQITRIDQGTNQQVSAYMVLVPTPDGRTVLFLLNRLPG